MTYLPASDRYSSMPYRRAGLSGLLLPALSLGLWHNFGAGRPIEIQRAIIRRAFDLGITHFDLANNYGPPAGSAEANFGLIYSQDLRRHRDEILVSTKAGFFMWDGPYGEWGSRKNLLASLDQSLARMQLDYVDVFYSHRPDPDTPLEETMGALASAVTSGKALYVGVSSYSPEQTREASRLLKEMRVPFVLHQPAYSMFDRRPEESRLFGTLRELELGSIVFSPLAQGLLTDRYLNGIPSNSRVATGGFLTDDRITPEYLSTVAALTTIAQRRGQTLAQLALAWVLRLPEVTSAIIGASSVAQLEQNVSALRQLDLSGGELEEIDHELQKLTSS